MSRLEELIRELCPDGVEYKRFDIEYCGLTYSLTTLAKKLLRLDYITQGPKYWTYQGKALRDIRQEREEQGLYK